MDKITNFIKSFQGNNELWNVFMALVIFMVGWLVCKIISGVVATLLKKLKLDERLNQADTEKPFEIQKIISKFVYYVLLIYVLIASLEMLGIEDVLNPVEMMFIKFLGVIPNIVAALFIAFLGYVLSRTVGQITKVAATGIDPLVNKAGISKKLKVSNLLGQLVFIFIFIPIVITALHVLEITAISQPAIAMLEELLSAIPNIIGAAIILLVSYIIGRLMTNFIAELLENLGADGIPKIIGAAGIFGKRRFSKFCGNIAFFFIMLGAAMIAVEILELDSISSILMSLLVFSGKVVLGLIILGIGNLIATFAHDSLAKTTNGGIYPVIVRIAILAFVLAMGLHTMGIAEHIVEMAFMFIFGTLGVTIILAFGLGGRDAAGKTMECWMEKLRK